MLVLSRRARPAESTVRLERPDGTLIGRVVLIGQDGDRVRIGFAFGEEVVIVRDELAAPPGAKPGAPAS